ncbi:MAG: sel1 repeat family protein [Clostridia bacterium]|nr:sel1 repeat family protein [Clostridia bacterium]
MDINDFKDDYIPEEDYYGREDDLAFAHTLYEAEGGNADSQRIMGEIYSNAGHGVKVDYKKAEYWYLKSAKQGNGRAQCELGIIYAEGKHGAADCEKAAALLESSAKQGNYRAADALAKLYLYGYGVAADRERAVFWAEKGAEGHYPSSYFYLALAHEKDKTLYEKYLLEAIKFNYENAYPKLFVFYLEENRKDDAVKIYNLAIKRGHGKIMENFKDKL